MPLNFSIVESFTSEYREAMRDKTLLRHERYHMLSALRERLYRAMRDYETFEADLSSMIRSIEEANTYEKLGEYHRLSVAGVRNYFLEEQALIDVHDVFGRIRDAITARVLCLVEREMEREGLRLPPVGYSWVGLGSEGRNEQTFVTDQDNMIIYEVGAGEIVASYYTAFARRVVEKLDLVGFSKCKGGIMPSNEKWRGSTRDWEAKVRETLTEDKKALELLDLIILSDARHICGAKGVFDAFLRQFHALLSENKAVMKELIQSAVLMPTALGFFGRFKVETEGEHRGKLNIKLHGWAPLIMSVRALALAEGLTETNTLTRIRKLREMNLIKRELEEELVDAYFLFVKFRVMNQIHEPDSNDANHVEPDALDPEEAATLRKGMRVVESFQKYVSEMLLFGQPF